VGIEQNSVEIETQFVVVARGIEHRGIVVADVRVAERR